MKSKDKRELEIIATLRGVAGVDQNGIKNLEDWFATLAKPEREILHNSLHQGKYTANKSGFFASQTEINLHAAEKSLRQLKRALTAVMVAKSMQSSPGLPFATHIQQANTTGANTLFTVYGRIKAELVSFDNSRQALIGTNIALSNWTGWEPGKYRPLKVGCNIGRRGANGPGTLGCFVTIGNNIYILSNQHVLAQLSIDNATADDVVIQPAHQCGGSFFDTIADGIINEPTLDAAIAKVQTGIYCDPTTLEGRAITGSGAVQPNSIVYKRGCGSKARIGLVIDTNSANVPKPGNITAVSQFLVRTDASDPSIRLNYPFQVQGDSGSVVMDAAGRVVGLLHGQVAGQPNVGQATHIAPILTRFGCQILTQARLAP